MVKEIVLSALQKTLLSELKRLWKTSDIWRSLLEYMDITDIDGLAKMIANKGFETTREVKTAASNAIIELFEAQVWESYDEYRTHMGEKSDAKTESGELKYHRTRGDQAGGWLGIDDDIKEGIDDRLETFKAGGVVRYAKALLKWKNSPKYKKWEWSDWYITGDEIHEQGRYSDDMILDRLGFEKLEGIKDIWKTQTDR